jgi:multicomponent Na+:H+ antiporter subunit D
LHVWLPNAYAYAPSVVTAFLAGTATKVAVYLMVRFFFSVFGVAIDFRALPVTEVLLALSIAAIFVASIIAVFESDLKRMLAYSSVAQIGYITLGIALANQSGLTGGLVHLFNHAVMKAGLFLALGAIFFRLGTVRIGDLAGLGRKMPLTMLAFAVAGFGIVGTPGTAGFISKWYLAIGALDRGWWWLVLLIVVSSLIALVYIGRVVEVVWFRPTSSALRQAADPPPSMMLPILALAAATIYFGFDTNLTANIAAAAAKMLLGGLR